MNFTSIFYPESKFGGFTDIDGTIIFFSRVNSLIHPAATIVDFGCGRGAYGEDPVTYRRELRILKTKCSKVIGIDVSDSAKDNPYLDEVYIIENNRWPLDNETVDLVMADSVLEHLKDPEAFFSECRRVIKPGGYLCLRTTNALGYVGLLSRLIPNKFHHKILKKTKQEIGEEDVFPTYYLCNTVTIVRKKMIKFGFDHCVYGYQAEPGYLSFSKLLYWLGTIHQKFAPGYIKSIIFAFGKKQ